MPFEDGTGPAGKGSRTGRGAGNCTGQGRTGRFGGRGQGRGRGGRGMGRGVGYASGQDNFWLEEQVKSLQAALQSITERLDAMKKD